MKDRGDYHSYFGGEGGNLPSNPLDKIFTAKLGD